MVYCWNSVVVECDVVLLIGEQLGLEWEIEVLCQLIYQIYLVWVVFFYDLLVCIEDLGYSLLGCWLVDVFFLLLVGSVGYDMLGFFGSWCVDIGFFCIIVEFLLVFVDEVMECYLLVMIDLLCWQV